MQLILFGIIAVIGVIVYFCRKKTTQSRETCPSCGAYGGGISSSTLEKITAERQFYSYDGKEYIITFYFKCPKCGKEHTYERKRVIEYKLKDDVVEAVRTIAESEWGIPRAMIPHYRVEITW